MLSSQNSETSELLGRQFIKENQWKKVSEIKNLKRKTREKASRSSNQFSNINIVTFFLNQCVNCSFIYITSIHILCVSVWVFVCLCPIIKKGQKRLNRSGPNFLWGLTWPHERFMDNQN